MVIGIDVREGVKIQRAGKGEYVHQLVNELIKNNNHQFVLFSDQKIPSKWDKPNVKTVIFKLPSVWWQLVMVGYLNFPKKLDVYFSPTSLVIPALVFGTPVVVAIMDFVSFILPEGHNKKAVLLEKLLMKKALNNAQHIIAISDNTKRDAMRLFSVPENKITTIHLAGNLKLSQQKLSWTYPRPIILHIGTLEPRKNISRLVQAFNEVKKFHPSASLILVGKWGWQSDTLKQEIATHKFEDDIHVITNLDNTYTQAIYKQSDVFVFPSLYEGFGLPPLEAMAMGVPVIAADFSSIPEVVGDAALLVDPKNVEDIGQSIIKVLSDETMSSNLIQKGLIQAKKFSWQKTTQETLNVLENV